MTRRQRLLTRLVRRHYKRKPAKYVPFADLHTRIRREMVESDRKVLADAIFSLDGRMLPEGAKIEFVHPSNSSSFDEFSNATRRADREISKAILGRSMTTDVQGGSLGTFSK